MHEGNSSLKYFMARVEADIKEREAKEFGNSKVKLDLYRRFGGKKGICMAVMMRELDSCLSVFVLWECST